MLKSHHHLSQGQRCQIYALKKRGLTQAGIAVDIVFCQLPAIVDAKSRLGDWYLDSITGANTKDAILPQRHGLC